MLKWLGIFGEEKQETEENLCYFLEASKQWK